MGLVGICQCWLFAVASGIAALKGLGESVCFARLHQTCLAATTASH